ncbi:MULTISPECIES: helix-turn-helix domain-containing protein [Pseudomonas]|uniref:helix-turn-helix domain-containing protein n=1 Tax=Pseudomonas TaxID=286 RepID=UPI00226E77A9|nr:helix-turn-helix domain-containing protein [Pseudomonas putida]WAB99911.1 helix-turn-helix domain-containing protein [Pseudomonas putida]
MSSRFFASVLTRLKQITQSESDAQLARALGVSPQTLSSWKVRDSIPYSLCVDIARQHACSLDWLLMGERGRTLHTAEGWEDDMLERLRSLSRTDREATLLYIKDKQRIQELEKKLDALAYRLPDTSKG